MPSRTLDICDISTRIVPVQKAFSLITRRSTKTDGPRIQAKALRRAVVDVLDHPVIQRCQLHKIRNVKTICRNDFAAVSAAG